MLRKVPKQYAKSINIVKYKKIYLNSVNFNAVLNGIIKFAQKQVKSTQKGFKSSQVY